MGLAGAAGLTRSLRSLLFGVKPIDAGVPVRIGVTGRSGAHRVRSARDAGGESRSVIGIEAGIRAHAASSLAPITKIKVISISGSIRRSNSLARKESRTCGAMPLLLR